MDVIARALGPKISQSLGQVVVVENKAGAGGNIGSDFVAKSAGEGYTMMITSIGMATNRFLYPKLVSARIKVTHPARSNVTQGLRLIL